MQALRSSLNRLLTPLDIMPLVFFRVIFGGIMLWEVWRYFHFDRIFRYYIQPEFHFHYMGFAWLQPLPGNGMIWLFHLLGLLSVFIMAGLFYRAVMLTFWLIFTYIFLLDQTQYLNHFYLISLMSFLLIFVPAHRKWSLDALLRPRLRAEVAPAWALYTLRAQLAIVYIFGGIAKINPDWLRGQPMRDWLADRTDFPLIGHLFTEEWMVYSFSYGGLLFDLLVVPLILWRRTRWFALAAMLGFHITNARLFNIGIFPWFAIGATLLFLPPDWFRFWRPVPAESVSPKPARMNRRDAVLFAGLGVYFALQLVLPMRHLLFPGDPSWTEEGHNLAWHMKLRSKDGFIALFASDPSTGTTRQIPIEAYLQPRQHAQMSDNPEMILRFAHHLAAQDAYQGQEIRAWSFMALNNRAPQLLLDPSVNLAAQPDTIGYTEWILPLVQAPGTDETSPALLISRRHDGVLLLINMTDAPFTLADLAIHAGDALWRAETSGVAQLPPQSCVIAHQASADLSQLFPICNEIGARQGLPDDTDLWQLPLVVQQASRITRCEGLACVVTSAG